MISIVCPVLNESLVLRDFLSALYRVLDTSQEQFEIIFVNDGSTDGTLATLLSLKSDCEKHAIRIIDLSRNFGKEAALSAGLDYSVGDAVIPIDADLQDPPELILQMIEKWREGYDEVVARRIDRNSDNASKRVSAHWFYRIMNWMTLTPMPENVGDFRLLDRKVVDAIMCLPEKQRFMKGIFAWVGFNVAEVTYSRPQRCAGKTKFNAWKLWNFAIDGITSFSTIPLRIWTYIGVTISIVSFLYGSFIVIRTVLFGVDVPGYASLVTIVLFLGGVQLVGLGVLGEYIGRIYLEVKSRPLYIVKREYS